MPENNQQKRIRVSPGWLVIAADLLALLALAGAVWYGREGQKTYTRLLLERNLASLEAAQENDWKIFLAETANARRALRDSLITVETLPEFIDRLEALASSAHIDLALNGVTPADKTNKLRITLTAEGPFSRLWHYATLLEQLPTQFSFTQATLSRQDTAQDEKAPKWQWQADLELPIRPEK